MASEPDPVAAELAAIKERLGVQDRYMSCPCGRGDYGVCRGCPYWVCSVHGAPGRLLAAAEAVLRDHEPRTPIPPNRHYRICRACSRIWPCPTVQDITRELLGKEGSHA